MDDSKTERGGFVKSPVPLSDAVRLADNLKNQLLSIADRITIVGSVLRRKPVVGDIDILILPKDLQQTLRALSNEGFRGDDRIQRKVISGILVEIYIAHRENELGALKLYATGDVLFMRMMREAARDFGLELTPYGLYVRESGKPFLQSPYERDIFEVLGLPYTPPHERSTTEKVRPSLGDRYIPPSEWPEFAKRMTAPSKSKSGKMFPGINWDLKPFRAPDREDEGRQIWYGPGGKDGEYASVILFQEGGWEFTEYSGVEGLIPNPPAPILSIATFVSFKDLARAALEKSGIEVPLDALERSPDAWAGFAATLGAVKIAAEGGLENWVETLP